MPERHSEKWLAWRLGVPLCDLRALASDVRRHYHPFPKVRAGGSPRLIDNPDEQLKAVQRRIRAAILGHESLDESVHGCVKGRSPRTNAEAHCGQRSLARIDVKNCFPSVTNKMVFRVFRGAGMGPKLARLLTILTTHRGHLPQGAPTSDLLANLALKGSMHACKNCPLASSASMQVYGRLLFVGRSGQGCNWRCGRRSAN